MSRFLPLIGFLFMLSSCSNILVVGHRGTRGYMPENTWPAFEKALEMGVDAIEMDVIVSKDGELIVSHDTYAVSEICLDPKGQLIPEAKEKEHNFFHMSYNEIQAYDCGTKPHPRFPLQKKMKVSKPRLSEVVQKAEAWGKAHHKKIQYFIEIKSTREEEKTFHPLPAEFAKLSYEAFKSLGILERTTVLSFDDRVLSEMKKIDPKVVLDFLVENKDGIAKNLSLLNFKPDIYGLDFDLLTKEDVQLLHKLGIQVAPWTLNTPEALKKAVEMGVDSLTTDYPDRAISLLK